MFLEVIEFHIQKHLQKSTSVIIGYRLPIIQGGTFTLIAPAIAILNLPENQCPPIEQIQGMSEEDRTELWQSRMRTIQGSLAVASLIQVVLGFTGNLFVIFRMSYWSIIASCSMLNSTFLSPIIGQFS